MDDLEIAVAEYIDWFNHRRLHGEIGLIPPAEHEDNFYRHNTAATTVAASVPSLHLTRGETECGLTPLLLPYQPAGTARWPQRATAG
ncbi:IS3 family transposase [Modestobacter sp. I12A-02662]|uniref:IS3 family transposase n=1 Tax=Modestobacter sp. I12A-02662 TaxID=1730496 RepID=UPI0034E01E5D